MSTAPAPLRDEGARPPARSRASRALRALALALGTLLVLDQLLLFTFLTRPVNGLRSLIVLTPGGPPHYELGRGLDTRYASWREGRETRVRTSSLGLRERERPIERAGALRVVATGDSITFGIGVDDDDAYPQQLERLLRERGSGDVEVWNAGVPGYAMADLLGFLRRRLLALEPDVIVLQLSKNDSAVPMPLSPAFMASLGFSGLARAYMIVRFNFVRDPRLFDESFEAYVRECEAAGVRLLVATEGVPVESRALVERLSRERGFSLVEIGGDAYPKLPDDPHFDPEGNRRVAERLAPEIEAMRGVVR